MKCLTFLEYPQVHKSFQIIDMSGGLLSQIPWIRFIAPDKSGYRKLVNTMQPLWDFLKENIDDVIQDFDASHQPTNFIEGFCREMFARDKSAGGKFFSKEQLLALCLDFFQAGSETTSNTLTFGMLYMLRHPEVKQKVQYELDKVCGDISPKLSDRPKLKYTEATICEIQRLSNVAPLGIAHRTLSDVKVDQWNIPKNSVVLFNIYGMHMDEAYWEDPFKFMPERFLDDTGELILHDSFIPFGD